MAQIYAHQFSDSNKTVKQNNVTHRINQIMSGVIVRAQLMDPSDLALQLINFGRLGLYQGRLLCCVGPWPVVFLQVIDR